MLLAYSFHCLTIYWPYLTDLFTMEILMLINLGCLTTYKPCLSLQERIIHSLLGPTRDMEYNHSPAVSFLSCIEESSPLMYLTSISAAMSGRLMIADLLRAATNSDQVELCEDLSHSLSIAVKRPSEVRRSFSIACRMENLSWTIILYNLSSWQKCDCL